jgi:hypothetical protein
MDAFINWLQEPGKWNDAAFLCGVTAVVILSYLIKKDGRIFWRNF